MDRARLVILFFGALAWAEPRRSKSDQWGRKDLFGLQEDPSPLVPYSSYLGELAPFWSFQTNGKFNLIDINEEPRRRARAAFELAWNRLGRDIPAQDRLDTAASELVETDPEPPRRPEEFISDQERPRDVPTRPKYGLPGGWARGQMPDKKVDIGFVPLQIYSQTRRYDLEEHLPRERAVEEAETDEEKLAAPRLREVLRNKKLHEIYEEEGYEDLGYDHGGYNHHGEQVEDVVKNEGSVIKKLPSDSTGRDSDAKGADTIPVVSPMPADRSEESIEEEESNRGHLQSESRANEVSKLDVRRLVGDGALKPRNTVTRSAKQSLTIHVPGPSDRVDVAESRSGSSLESRIVNNPSSKITFPGRSTRRLYTSWDIRPQDGSAEETVSVPRPPVVNVHHVASYSPYRFNDAAVTPVQFSASTPMQFASSINTYASLINQNFSSPLANSPIEYSEYDTILPSYSTDDYVWAHSNVHEQRVSTSKPIKFEDEVNTSDATTTKSTVSVDLQSSTESSRKQSGRQRGRRRGHAQSSTTESITEKDSQSSVEFTTSPSKSSRKNTTNAPRKMYSNFTRGSVKYNPEDDTQWTPTVGTPNIRHPSLPFDNGENKEVKVEKPTKEPEVAKAVSIDEPIIRKPGQEEMAAIRDPAANAKYVEQLTLAHFSVPANLAPQPAHFSDQDERLKELAKQLNAPDTFGHTEGQQRSKRSAIVYDKSKYPHYDSPPSISMDSAVKYATNPDEFPKKTYGGMEFYESKESIKCSGPPQPKNILPKREEDGEWKGEPSNDGPRLNGVGDAIDCFKKKFFGSDPLDNPLFKEGDAETAEKIENAKAFEETIPLKVETVDPGERRIMVFGQNPVSNLTAEFRIAEPVLKAKFSPSTSRPFLDSVTFTTPHPLSPYDAQYQVYEINPDDTATPSPYKYKHYWSLHPSKFQYQLQMARPQKYVPHKLSAYQFMSENTIPTIQKVVPYSAGGVKVIPYSGAKEVPASYSSGIYRAPMYVRPTEYVGKKIIIRKRETESSLWDMINPLKWWWPNLFDSRRKEPRYRRSVEDYESVMPSSEEIDEVGREMIEMMASDKPTTTLPITLSEFKSKLNITNPKKTTSSRLTGGFLNRNPDITDVIEMLVGMGPTDSMMKSTTPVSTTKPKVVFPRAKLPKRKTYPGTKKPSIISELPTTEATTTTTTTTVPPSTTTRMYKPKRVIKKNYGKGPFDAFTVLRTQQEVKATKQTFESTEAMDAPTTMRQQQDEPRTISSETAGENDTLTYMVNPATGVGSWSEQRKWKPKRKRPNRPSVYSYHRLKNSGSKKKQRDIPDPHQKAYVYGLMSKLLSPYPREYSSTDSSEQEIRRRSSEEQYPRDAPVTSVKPPPKFILEPDKRRYYYAKVR